MMDPKLFFYLILGAFGAGFVLPIVFRRWRLATYASLVLALAGSSIAGAIWFLQPAPDQVGSLVIAPSCWLEAKLPRLQLEIRIDALSAFFTSLVGAFSTLVALYSFSALKAPHYKEQRHRIASAFNAFVWSTIMVVIVNDVFFLIAALEIMTLAFGYLALHKHSLYLKGEAPTREKKYEAAIAPQVYLIVSHTSTAFLLASLLLLAIKANSLSFDSLRAASRSLDPAIATTVFLLALIGLGIRAGLTPAHFWVSLVHPCSPTTTHALSLGIAIKVAIYLMLRVFFQFLSPQPWWGYAVLMIGSVTALVNVWYAIASHDLKVALAYHSIENIGIIIIGVGVALIYADGASSTGGEAAGWITALALVASLYHLLNHAVFKGLLYLCTGAIENLTNQTVDMERLGGLIKLFPWTSWTFLVGAISISGFPPFNGFVGEWLTIQALLNGLTPLKANLSFGMVIVIVSMLMLVASFALTAFCFVKIAGTGFLGAPRSLERTRADWSKNDVPWLMRSVMLLMASFCLLLGLVPAWTVGQLSRVVAVIMGGVVMLPGPSALELELVHQPGAPILMPVVVPLAIALALGIVAYALTKILRPAKGTAVPETPWNGGTPYEPVNMQYTGAALSYLTRSVGPASSKPPNKQKPDHPAVAPGIPDGAEPRIGYLPSEMEISRSETYPQVMVEFFRETYNKWIDWTLRNSETFGDFMQNRDIRRYLFYIFIANIIALVLFLAVRGS